MTVLATKLDIFTNRLLLQFADKLTAYKRFGVLMLYPGNKVLKVIKIKENNNVHQSYFIAQVS